MAQNKALALPCVVRQADELLLEDLREMGVDPILARLFAARELESAQSALTTGKGLLPWQAMKGAPEAVELLMEAIRVKERIVVVADYDSDGATSCAVAVRALRSFGADVQFAVPNRFVHGYGLTPGVVEMVRREFNPELIITVDNGISSVEGVKKAKECGIKVLVTDHHLAPEILPEADVIVNPNQKGCKFPSKNMAGCGVIFYVMAGLRESLKKAGMLDANALTASALLDYVAIGTIADVVKLDENNRVLARLGLERIRQGRAHPGVCALFAVSRRSMPKATSKDIGFAVGPRINAAGRLDDMSIGIKCLLSDSLQEAMALALKLDELNRERKKIETDMSESANVFIEKMDLGGACGICVKSEDFHEGVIGIVAGRIKERQHRPTIVFAPSGEAGLLKGSGRSIPGFHLRDALDVVYKRSPGLIAKFGGHAMAAGLSIPSTRYEEFEAAFDRVCKELLTKEALDRCVMTDGDLDEGDMTLSLAEKIATEVWGQGFSEPLFCSQFDVVEQTLIKNAHLKLTLRKRGGSEHFQAMWFFQSDLIEARSIEAVYSLECAEFRNEEYLSLQIQQAKPLDLN